MMNITRKEIGIKFIKKKKKLSHISYRFMKECINYKFLPITHNVKHSTWEYLNLLSLLNIHATVGVNK